MEALGPLLCKQGAKGSIPFTSTTTLSPYLIWPHN